MGRRSRRPRHLARHPPPRRRHRRLRTPTRPTPNCSSSGGPTCNAATTSTAGCATTNPASPPSASPTSPPAEIRQRLDELDTILATAPPDQTRILDALHTGQLHPADLDDAIRHALATQDSRRDWILEHWPHVVEHAELTRLDHAHGPLDHWPIPLPAAAQQLYDQLVAITVDTPEPRTLTQLDHELADADPRTHIIRLRRDLDTLDEQQRQLRAERADLNQPEQVADIDRHLTELARRCRDLDDQLTRHTAKASLWTSGHRPRDLTDAINRRSHHLAHQAITNGDQWVTEAVRAWHTAHPDGDIHHLQRTVIEIAAHRERSDHHGTDPLGPAPDTQTRCTSAGSNYTTSFTSTSTSERRRSHCDGAGLQSSRWEARGGAPFAATAICRLAATKIDQAGIPQRSTRPRRWPRVWISSFEGLVEAIHDAASRS